MKADIWPLVLVGDPIPNTPNFRFTGFGQAVVNTSGTIAFHASFTTPDNLSGQGIFKIAAGQLTPVMLEGQPVPGAPGSSFGASSNPHINSAGDIVFWAYLSGHTSTFQGIFLKSGDTLQDVVDFDTAVPGVPGEHFNSFFEPQINDRGDIAFGAGLMGGSRVNGIFVLSSGSLQLVTATRATAALSTISVDAGSLSLNNRSDIAFVFSLGVSRTASDGSPTTLTFPQTVPSTNYVMYSAASPSIDDDGDVMLIGTAAQLVGRGSFEYQVGVLRWRSGGTLEKIVAPGDPVPGFPGAVFGTNFLNTRANQSGVVFVGRTAATDTVGFGVIEDFHDGQLTTVASENQYVDGIGTLDSIDFPNFDTQQGPLITFLAGAAAGSMTGIYATTAAPQYTLRFPQIADGGGGVSGGWRTTFVLANRSTTPATATVSFYDDTGAPLSLTVGGMQQTQTTVNVPALGVAQVQTQGGGPLTVGWALVQSDQNLTGSAIYGLLDRSGNSVSEVGVPASLPLLSMSVFAQAGATTSTGVALANPNSTAATVTLILRDANSSELSRISVVVPAMGHLARYANELFSGMPPGEFNGKIEVISTQPLAGLTLRQQGDSVFTSLPVIP
jgi:hypothetical protein